MGEPEFKKFNHIFCVTFKPKVPCPSCRKILRLVQKDDGSIQGWPLAAIITEASADIPAEKTEHVHSVKATDEADRTQVANSKPRPSDENATQLVSVIPLTLDQMAESTHELTEENDLPPFVSEEGSGPYVDEDGSQCIDTMAPSLSKTSKNPGTSEQDKTQMRPFRMLSKKEEVSAIPVNQAASSAQRGDINTFKLLSICLAGICVISASALAISLLDKKPKKNTMESTLVSMPKAVEAGSGETEISSPVDPADLSGEEAGTENTLKALAHAHSDQPSKNDARTGDSAENYPDEYGENGSDAGTEMKASENVSESVPSSSWMPAEEKPDLSRYQKSILDLPPLSRMTSSYGVRLDPFTHKLAFHGGVDFRGPIGTPVRAALDGVVKFAGQKGKYGYLVVLTHDAGFETRYAHLSKIHVKKGQRVNRSDHIANIGNTGRSTGPHLHFELLKNGKKVHPLKIKLKKS